MCFHSVVNVTLFHWITSGQGIKAVGVVDVQRTTHHTGVDFASDVALSLRSWKSRQLPKTGYRKNSSRCGNSSLSLKSTYHCFSVNVFLFCSRRLLQVFIGWLIFSLPTSCAGKAKLYFYCCLCVCLSVCMSVCVYVLTCACMSAKYQKNYRSEIDVNW